MNISYKLKPIVNFLFQIILAIFSRPFYYKNFILYLVKMGYDSLAIVITSAFSVGMVMSLQLGNSIEKSFFGNVDILGQILGEAVIKELGPVVAGFMLAGRIGASVSSEIGSMKISEQIYALISLAVNPIQYLVIPRLMAMIIIAPIFTVITYFFSLLGGAVCSYFIFDQNFDIYFESLRQAVTLHDTIIGIFKGTLFGIEILIISCYVGLNTENGSEGVGKATTTAVVVSNIFVIFTDYIVNYSNFVMY